MSFLWVAALVGFVITVFGITLIALEITGTLRRGIVIGCLVWFVGGAVFLYTLVGAIAQPIDLRQQAIYQTSEREQILLESDRLPELTEYWKARLNERIETYNHWVNEVNTSKKKGWFSYYYNFDMTNHTIIGAV